MAFVRREQELSLCWTVPVPASSKRPPPLTKTEPISNIVDAFEIAYLRKGKSNNNNNYKKQTNK